MSRPIPGLVINPDKTIVERTFSSLADYQDAVGGYIEAVTLSDGTTMYVDEEFTYKHPPGEGFNSIASDVAGLGGRQDLMLTGILGPVVVVGPPNDEGETTGITGKAKNWVKRVAREAGGVYITDATKGAL